MSLLTITIISLALLHTTNCGEFAKHDGHLYYVSNPRISNWHQAYRYCASLGMYLLDIRTEVENDRVRRLLDNYYRKLNVTNPTSYWTSGTDQGSEGNFYWFTTGQQVLYNDWFDSNPDNWMNPATNESENCIVLAAYRNYQWNDGGCSMKFSFICRDTYDVVNYKSYGCSVSADFV